MDDRVRKFIREVARTMVGLDVALFYQANPSTFDTCSGIALRTHRVMDEIRPALERLAEHRLLEVHVRADGKYTCYALAREPWVWNLLCLVSDAYHDDPEARKEILMMLVRQQQEDRQRGKPDGGAPSTAGSDNSDS